MSKHINEGPIEAFSNLMTDDMQRSSKSARETKLMYAAEVVSVDDPKGASRVRVFIPDIDQHMVNQKEKLPWANHFGHSNIQHLPLVGERVMILLENPWVKTSGRWWVGPIFSEDVNVTEPFEESKEKSGLD